MNDQQLAAEPSEFEKWLCREMPSGTVIHDPHWWAIKIQAALAQREPLTDTFVQVVPDKCDRIVWRNAYYHLPIARQEPVACELYTAPPPPEPVAEEEVRRFDAGLGGAAGMRPGMFENPGKGRFVLHSDWQRTEAARLAAEKRVHEVATYCQSVETQCEYWHALYDNKEEQLAAERERSEKLVEELDLIRSVLLGYPTSVAREDALRAVRVIKAAYQSSKEKEE